MEQIHIFYNQAIIWHSIIPVFTQICKKFAAYEYKIVFVMVSGNYVLNIVQECISFIFGRIEQTINCFRDVLTLNASDFMLNNIVRGYRQQDMVMQIFKQFPSLPLL